MSAERRAPGSLREPAFRAFSIFIRTLPLKQKYFSTRRHLRFLNLNPLQIYFRAHAAFANDLPVFLVTTMTVVNLTRLVIFNVAVSSCEVDLHAGVTVPFI